MNGTRIHSTRRTLNAVAIAAIFAIAALTALCLTACGGQPSRNDANPGPGEKADLQSQVKMLGRTYVAEDGTIWCGQSGTGVEFEFEGTQLAFDLQGDDVFEPAHGTDGLPADQHNARFAIFVDGELQQELFMNTLEDKSNGTNTKHVEVFSGDQSTKAHVRLVKLSENTDSTFGITRIDTNDGATVTPSASKDLKIEFVGDSVTCAAGIETQPSSTLTTTNENFGLGYAYLTAQKLDADYSVIATSGIGVCSGWTPDATKNGRVMANSYENYGQSNSTYGGADPAATPWDFSRYTPDVVVINLSTNDETYVGDDPQRTAEFTEAYVELLKMVRGHNPSARIICANGMMGVRLTDTIRDVVSAYASENGDDAITLFEMKNHAAEDGVGVLEHPNVASHAKAADELAEYIRTIAS